MTFSQGPDLAHERSGKRQKLETSSWTWSTPRSQQYMGETDREYWCTNESLSKHLADATAYIKRLKRRLDFADQNSKDQNALLEQTVTKKEELAQTVANLTTDRVNLNNKLHRACEAESEASRR